MQTRTAKYFSPIVRVMRGVETCEQALSLFIEHLSVVPISGKQVCTTHAHSGETSSSTFFASVASANRIS